MTPLHTSVYFIDSTLPDLPTLLAGVPAGAEVHLIEPGANGVQLLADTLAGRTGVQAIHLLTHGSAGSLNLGGATLSSANLAEYAAQWSTIQSALTEQADLLIYGCNVAEGEAGAAFVSQLATLTGADVAASTDLTGAARLGGDWDLEASTGAIEAPALAIDAMDGVLASGILQNKYVRFGYSDDGTLGVGSNSKPGIQYDPAGNRNFLDTADSLTPGSPFEGFTVKVGSTSYTENNAVSGGAATQGTYILNTDLTTVGSDTWGSVTFRTERGGLRIDQTLSLASADAKVISVSVKVENISGGAVNSVSYARFTDPDVDSNGLPGATSSTNNTIGASGIAASDIVLATGPVSGRVIGLYSDSSFTHKTAVSSGWSSDPSVYLAGANNGNGDYTIGIGFNLGNFAAGQSKTFSFAYVFAASAAALTESVNEVPKSNPAPTLTTFDQPVDTTNEDTSVTITYAELIAKGNEADLNADNTAGSVTGFLVKKVNGGTLTIGGSPWAIGSNDLITSSKDAVWTPALNANGTLTAFEVVARDAEGAVSATNVGVQVAVTAVNDRPTLVSNPTLRTIIEDIPDASNIGSTVADLFAPRFSDVDSGATLNGIVITANAEATLGAWQYSTDSGTTWHDVGTVSTAAGLVLDTNAKLRFAPGADKSGVPTALTVHALDNTYGTSFTIGAVKVTFDTTTATATGPLSTNTATLGVEVTAVNDAPTFTSTAATATIGETAAADAAVGTGITLTATAGSAVTANKLTGTLTANDVDHDPATLAFSIRGGSEAGGVWTKQGLFGTLTLNADKTWSYEVTKFDAINALPDGATATESFDFKVADAAGASAAQALTITLTGTNDTPILAATITDQTLTGTGAWQYQIPAASFTDAEGAGLTYTVKVVSIGGSTLDTGDQYAIGASTSGGPTLASSWLTFDAASRTFTGNPPTTTWGNQAIGFEVTASDGSLSATGSFNLTISGNTNQPPVVSNPLQWAAADAPKEVTTVDFGTALGGTTVTFDGATTTLGTKATGDAVAAAFVAAGTTNYTAVQGTGGDTNKLTLTARVAGDRTDFTDGTVTVNGGSYTVAVTQEGANATTEVWKAQFADITGASWNTLEILGRPINLSSVTTPTTSELVLAIQAQFVSTPNVIWNITQDATNTDTLVFTARTAGDKTAVTFEDFSIDGSPAANNSALLVNNGLTETTVGVNAVAEIVTLTFDGAYAGASVTIDGTAQTVGSTVTAPDAAAGFAGGTYPNHTDSVSDSTVTLIATTPGDKTDIVAGDFTVTGAVTITPTVTKEGSGWQVSVPSNTFSDVDGDTLTYTARTFTIDGSGVRTYANIATGNSAAPTAGALFFDAANLKLFGDGTSPGGRYIEISATDASGSNGTAASEFQLVVYNNSQSASLSAVGSGIPASVAFVNGAGSGSYTVPATAFNFVGEHTNDLTYSLQVFEADGTTLTTTPAWLSINAATGTISGNPPAGSTDIKVKVTATATTGGSATTDAFTLTIANPNDPLQLTTALPDQTASAGGAISILVEKPFTNPDGAANGTATKEGITYTATANGQALSTYGLTLTEGSGAQAGKLVLGGNVPAGISSLNIVVTGTETSGGDTETTSFTLNLGGTGGSLPGALRANDAGTVAITSNANIAAPKQGDVLTAQAPADLDGVPGTVSYQWQVSTNGTDWKDVGGARGQATTLTLGQTEVGLQIRVQAFYLDGGGVAEAPTSAALPATLDVNDAGSISISAGSSVGSTISGIITDADGLARATPTYQWQRADSEGGSYSNIAGATHSSYTITSADGGKWLKVVTTYTDDQSNIETNVTSAARNINLSQIAPVAANVAGTATEAGGVANGTAGTDATGSLRTGATDGNPGQAATLVVTGVRAGDTEGLGRPAVDGGTTFTISGEFGDLVVTKATGAYTYTLAQDSEAVQALNSGETLTEKFNFTLQDVDGLSDDGVLTLTINGANDKPTISGQAATATVVEDVPTALPLDVLSITDPDSTALTLTLSVTAGTLRVNSLDTAVTLSGNDTNTLTLTAINPLLLRGWLADNQVLYVTPPNQTGAVATLSYTINDTTGAVAASGTTAITATAANDAARVDADGNGTTTGNGGIATFKPRGEAIKVAPSLTLTDIDASALNLTSATVTLVSGAIDNQYGTIYEKLLLSTAGETARTTAGLTLSVTESAASVVLTLTGSATLAQYQAVLREVLYENSNPSAFTGDRAVSISVTDADSVLGNASAFKTTATNGSIAVGQRIFVNNVDTGAVVATVEDTQHFIASRPLTLSAGDTLKFYSAASQPTYALSSGSLVLAGGDTPLTTATVAAPRLPTVTVQVPWTPVVDLNGESTGRNHAVTYTEGESGRAIATADSSITDQDGALKQVTVQISNPQDGVAEKLFYTDAVATNLAYLGITVTGNNTHSLTFSATGKDATQFQPWLRAIQYVNTSENPNITPRQVVVTVTDADNNVGVPATTTVSIVPVNDVPVKGGDFAGALNEGAVYVFTTGDLNSTDVDNNAGTLKYILTSAPAQGTLFRDTNNNGVVDTGEAIATVGTSTSVSAINAIGTNGYFTQAEVTAGTIKYAHNGQNPNGTNATGTDTFGFKLVDGMEDYAFNTIPADTVTLTITEVNDAPTGTVTVTGTAKEGETLTATPNTVADADGPSPLTLGYKWQRSADGTTWTDIGSATSSIYILVQADAGNQVRAVVVYTDALSRAESVPSASVGTVVLSNRAPTGSVTADGSTTVGSVLTANTSALVDLDGLGPLSYKWQVYNTGTSTWVDIAGATASTYTLTSAESGKDVRVSVTYTDGLGTAEGASSAGVGITTPAAAPNAAPYLVGTAATLFSNVTASTVEPGQTIQTLTLTVSGLQDGVDEKLTIDGVEIALDTATTTAIAYPTPAPVGSVGGVSYAVSLAGDTATVTITHAGLTEAQTKSVVEGLAYSNSKGSPTAGLRVVTLSSLQDSGGGTDTGDIGLSATVDVGSTLPGSNTAPTVTGDLAAGVNEGAVVALATADLGATDGQQPNGLQVFLASEPSNGTLFRDANNNGVADTGETLGASSKFALADIAAGRIKYAHNGGETTSDSFTFNVSDGLALSDDAAGGTATDPTTFSITVTPVDDMPTLTATALGTSGTPVAFAEGAAAATLFSGAAASPVETGENITGLTVMVSGLRDGAAEKLTVDGTAIALTHGTTGTTGAGAVGYSVSVTGGTATVTLTKDATGTTWNSLIDGLKYSNTSENPTNGNRSITLSGITETGGQSSAAAISSHVAVSGVNDAPTLSIAANGGNPNGFTVAEGGSKTLTITDVAAADVDTPLGSLTYTLSTAPTHGTVYIDANDNGVLDSGEALATNGTFTHAQLSSGKVRYVHDDGELGDSFALTVSDGQVGGTSAPATVTVTRSPAVNDAPSITGLGTDVLTYPASSGAKTLEQGGNALVTDPDAANFNNGNLRVSITFNRDPANDVLSIANAGTGAGQIGVSGSNVSYAGTTIGTFTGGTGTNDLVVTFNTSATPEAVSALVKAIQFANGQAAPAHTSRTVSFALNDGQSDGQATPVAVNVNIQTGVTPSISIANGFFVMENTQLVTALSATDPNSRPITFTVSSTVDATNNPDAGKFEIVSGNLLRFVAAPDYETPDDAGANRVYNVIVRATNDQGSFAEQSLAVTLLDQDPETSAVGDTAGPAFGFATVNGTSLVMTYTDASPLATSNAPGTSAFTVKVGGTTVSTTGVSINSAAKTVTLTLASAVTAGQTVTVSYADPTTGNDVVALQDTAGNDAATLTDASVSNTTPGTNTGGGGGGGGGGGTTTPGGGTTTTTPGGGTTTTTPLPGGGTTTTTTNPLPGGGTTTTTTTTTGGTTVTETTTNSGGTSVTETVTTGTGGTTTTVTTVQPIGSNGTGGTGGTPATVPLVSGGAGGGEPLLSATLPTGVGLTAEVVSGTGLTLRQQLIAAANPRIQNDPAFREVVDEGIDRYVPDVTDQSQVTVRTITLNMGSNATGAPSDPVVINGAQGTGEDSASHPLRQEALVIDARNLPPGTVLRLDNVEFAIIVGASRVVGGDGRNFVVGDDSAQFIVLGAGDDVLRGGGGDDTVGSKAGNDQIYGDGGNDLLVGGVGNDILRGGDGNDLLQGGVSDAGAWSFRLDTQGQLHASFTPGDTELADNTGFAAAGIWTHPQGTGPVTDERFAWVYRDYNVAQDVALLVQALGARLPTLAEMGAHANGRYSSQKLGEMAHDYWVSTMGTSLPQTIDAQLSAVINHAWGTGSATTELISVGRSHLNAGGSWSDIWLALARHGTNAARITDAQGNVSLIGNDALGETGWAFHTGNDQLFGDAGNDVLIGGNGNDTLDGGAGTDVAVFFGSVSDYEVALTPTTITNPVTGLPMNSHDALLRHKQTGETDTVRAVEVLKIGAAYYSVPDGQAQPADGVFVELSTYVQLIGTAQVETLALHSNWLL